MKTTSPQHPRKPLLRPRGKGLALTGVLLAAFFGIYMVVERNSGEEWKSPMLVGVFLGVIMLGFGIYRAFKGPSSLDHARGGTNNESE